MALCRYCRTREADSDEHLFQSAIGGRRKVHGVLCTPCNNSCGSNIDATLVEAFRPFLTNLAIVGDDGQTHHLLATDVSGRKLIIRSGGLVEAAPTAPVMERIDDRTTNWSAYAENQAHDVIRKAQKRSPDKPINISMARSSWVFPEAVPFNFNWGDGSEDFFRSVMKTALVVIAARDFEGLDDALAGAWRYVAGGREEDCGVRVHASAVPAPWDDPNLGPVPHRVSVRSEPEHSFVAADVRYFGDVAICLKISARLPKAFAIGHGVDPFTGRTVDRERWIGSIGIPGAAATAALAKYLVQAVDRIHTAAQPRLFHVLAEKIAKECWREVMGEGHDEDPLPQDPATRAQLAKRVGEELGFILRRQPVIEDDPELLRRLQQTATATFCEMQARRSQRGDK